MTSSEILKLLPLIYRRSAAEGTILTALVQEMEAMHAPAEAVLAGIEQYLDPRRAPEDFVKYLAHWVDIARFLESERDMERGMAGTIPIPLGQLREWIAHAAELSRWRGTRRGMLMLLEAATGLSGFELDEAVAGETGRLRPFHFRLIAPEAARAQEALLERILELEKPAYMTYEAIQYFANKKEQE